MSLMSKLFLTLLSLSSLLFANEAQLISFLKKGIGSNPNIISLDIKVVSQLPLESPKGWSAYIVQLTGKANVRGKTQDISQRTIYFAGDGLVTAEMYDLASGEKLNTTVSPAFNEKYYDEGHHLFGNKDAAHKVVIFSDPLCPFCRNYVPEALAYMKKYPKTFDVYYYHFPLASLHPAAIPLVKAAFVAEMQGRKGVVESLYKVKVDGREPKLEKILKAFNEVQKTKVTAEDIGAQEVVEHLKHDMGVAEEHLVNGTPTVFFDGKKDTTKNQYKSVKLIK